MNGPGWEWMLILVNILKDIPALRSSGETQGAWLKQAKSPIVEEED